MNKTKFFSSLLVVILLASTSVFTSCKDYDDDIKKLQEQIDNRALKSELESLKTSLEAQIASVQNSLNTTKTELTAAINKKADQTTVDALASRVSTLESTVAGLQTQIDAINTALAKYATLDYVNGTFATKTALETEIAAVKAIIDGKVEELTKAIQAEAQARGEAITAEEAARKAADQAIEKSIKAQEEALAAYKKEMANTIEELKKDVGFSGTVKKLEEDIDAVDKALKAAKQEFASFKEQYIADKAAAQKFMTELSEQVNENLAAINILNAFVKKQVTSMVLMPNFYWEGIEAIEVPFAATPVFKPKAEDYKFTYKLSNAAAGFDVVDVTVKSTMGFVTANNKFVYAEKAVAQKGPWDQIHSLGIAGPTSLTTLDGAALMELQGVVDEDGLKISELSPGALAKYHINPSTADLSTATISFFENNAEVYTRTDQKNLISATPISPVVDGEITRFENGILTVPFKVDNAQNLKMFTQWALTGSHSINPEWDNWLLFGGDGDAAYGDGKTLPFIAAQLETNDTTVTSDYAVVVPAGIEIIALADNKPDKKINGRSTEFDGKDVGVIRANHLYESAGYEGQYDTDYYGAIPMPATHTVEYDGIFEFNFIETHYSYVTFTKYGQTTLDKVMDATLMKLLGLHYEYTLVDYIVGKNVTGESVHMEQVDKDGNPTSDHKSPYFAPRSVTEDGKTISGKVATREVIDREPLVRVDLVNENGEIVRYGYVKIRIIEEAPQFEDMEVTINLSEMYMNCGEEARVTWSQMENLILAKLWDESGMRKQEFEKFYYMDVVGNYENMPYVDPIAAGVLEPAGTLYAQAANNGWMAKRFWKDGNQYKAAQGSSNDDNMALLSKYTNTNNWFGRVWYTPHDNATEGHNWDEATNVIVWNLMGEEDLDGKYAYAGNMRRDAYAKLMQVTGATYDTKGLNKKQLSTVIRFVNKITESSIWVTLVLDVNKLHFATADINRRVLDHWYDYKEGYRDNTPDTIEVYANVPTPAEVAQNPLTTSSFQKDLKEYWLKKEIVPEVYDAKHFTKFWAGNKFLGKYYFQFRLPKSGENTVDIDADSKGKWKVDGISGNTYTLYLKDANKDGFNDEIWAEKNTNAGMSADELICRLSPEGIIEYMGRDKETLKTVGVTPADYEAAPAADKVNGAATDILNLIGMYDNKGNKQKEVYLTGHAKRTFAAYVQIKVQADNCYDPLMGKDYFNVRFLRPINAWPTETSITDAPNATQFIDIWKLLYIRDWRTYAVVPAGQKQKFVDDGITHEGNFKEGNVTYEFYNITNLWVRRHDIRSDAYLEPNKRVALTDPNDIKKLYSVDDIPALTNGAIEYLKIVPLSDFNTDAKKAAYSVDYIGQRASMLYSDLLAYTNNGGVVKPFHIYVPIAIEYPWGALHNWTQTVWATITVDPTVGNE